MAETIFKGTVTTYYFMLSQPSYYLLVTVVYKAIIVHRMFKV